MTEELETIATKLETEQVLITNSALPVNILNDTIKVCQKLGIKYKKVASIFDISSKQIQITRISEFPDQRLIGKGGSSFRSGINGKYDP